MSIHVKAHAKLNLTLGLGGRRSDGYHTIDTILQEITLCDSIEVERQNTLKIECPGVSPERNTVTAAARAFFELSGLQGGAEIRIRKAIPMGAGLGGGSSDAAAVLRALNQLYDQPLTDFQLMEAAAAAGADTPFFIHGGTQRAQGFGEILSPIENRCDFAYLLVKPVESVNTAEAYRLSDTMPTPDVHVERTIRALVADDAELFYASAGNALMPAAQLMVPEIANIGEDLKEAGAVFWLMTGSGSCVFSIFSDTGKRDEARARLADRYPFVACARNYRRDHDTG